MVYFLIRKETFQRQRVYNESTLNKLFKKTFDNIYAYQICALAIAFGLEPQILFEHFYGDKKKKFVLKVELVDADETEKEDELLVIDQEAAVTTFGRGIKIRTTTLRKHQHTTFDFIVQHTDYFLTPRTPVEIMKDFKKYYDINVTPSNIYGYLYKHLDNGLTKNKIEVLNANGSISKKPHVSFIKTKQQHAQYNIPQDEAVIQMINKHATEILEMNNAKEKEETEAINKLYAIIATNPGARHSFILSIFDIKVKVLESRLQKLQKEAKIEYRGNGKSAGYWLVSKEHSCDETI